MGARQQDRAPDVAIARAVTTSRIDPAPHPITVLHPGAVVPRLTTPADRNEALHELGADEVLTLRATPGLLALSAAEFFDRVLRQGLAARAMAEGPNFGFGHKRGGDIRV